MLKGFTETKTGVDNDVSHTTLAQLAHFSRKVGDDFCGDIFVRGCLLHGLRSALTMHQDVGYTQFGNRVKHLCVGIATRNIVDDAHAKSLYTAAGNLRTKCIYRKNRFGRFSAHYL